jgi:tRNA 5-methylaminomethyl-2-thiouridine biosynthesis bifunctional protein
MPVMTAIIPARIDFESGTPRSPAFDDIYHSADGGLPQARTVFLEGNGLPQRWAGKPVFQILETGFGIGLNFLATWLAWLQQGDVERCGRLHFVSVEKHPPLRKDLVRALSPYGDVREQAAQLVAAWPPLVAGLHRLEFEAGRIVLTLALGHAAACLPQLTLAADAVYLDGFAPARNPDMWDAALLRHVARLCAPDATLATWCVAGAVRRALEHEGFSVSRQPGFGHKRERLVAHFDRIPRNAFPRRNASGRNPVLAHALNGPSSPGHALIVGAGIAGCLMAESLARRGWTIDLIDRHPAPAQEASGNPAGILRPVLSKDDNLASRLGRAAFLHSLRTLDRLQAATGLVEQRRCGVLHLAQDETQAALQEAIVNAQRYPDDYVRMLDASEASRLAAGSPAHGGWLFPGGGWVNPPSVCRAALAAGASRVRTHWNTTVDRLAFDGSWRALAADGTPLAEAPLAILAAGAHAHEFRHTAHLPLQCIRGQISLLNPDPFPEGTPVICGDGYVISGLAEGLCVGATYDTDDDPMPRDSSTQENLARLERLVREVVRTHSGRVGFRSVARDRMPLAGPLPGQEGLHALMGMASRGLVWSSLCAELVACWVAGEPLPLEWDIVQAIAPARFGAASR